MKPLIFPLLLTLQLVDGLNLCGEPALFRFRIVGGAPVENGLNWMAKLVSFDESREGIMCGATVIDNHWLMTAAHCALQLRKRSYVTLRRVSGNKEATFTVREAFVHPDYDNETARNDIALLKISSDLSSYGFEPVCLVKDDSELLEEHKTGLVIGFGLSLDPTSESRLLNLARLQNTSVPIIPEPQCSKTWRRLSLRAVEITSTQICAGSYMHGTAPGDSGGPLLVRNSDGQYVQIGITSFGADGLDGIIDQGRFPGVYTRVSSFVPWMQRVIGSNVSFRSSLSTHPNFSIYSCIFAFWRTFWR